ncbi:MAG TPA: NAD(P)/FAD-dependent oxidoreductase [Gemmatimonadota bacterium]|nr:NAD(P)/FAD-dependent oxidoreductase [Gemmatimonadota bacterium]
MTPTVAVLGAGVAGLAAAAELAVAGQEVVVLEARDRVGGRIHTVRPDPTGRPVELGAEFIHGEPPSLALLAREAGLEVREAGGDLRELEAGRLRAPGGTDPGMEALFAGLAEARADESATDVAARVLPGPDQEAARRRAMAFVEGFHAADPRWVAARSLAGAGPAEAERSFRLPGGYDAVPRHLRDAAEAAGAEIVLEAPATRVDWSPGSVTVQAGGRPYRAGRLLVTLPLGVLHAPSGMPGAVRFEPDPARIRRAVERLAMGAAVRVVLRLSSALPAGLPGFVIGLGGDVPVWWSVPDDPPQLVGWAGGPPARRLAGRREEYVVERALDSLATLPDLRRADVESRLVEAHTHDWMSDPYSRGAYSYVPVGGLGASGELARPVEDTLYLAGEALAEGPARGTVHGALDSGRRAARRILELDRG